jgi:hypothetical protein
MSHTTLKTNSGIGNIFWPEIQKVTAVWSLLEHSEDDEMMDCERGGACNTHGRDAKRTSNTGIFERN